MKTFIAFLASCSAAALMSSAPALAQTVQGGRCTPGKFNFNSAARCTWALVISGKDGSSLAVISESFPSQDPCEQAGKDLLLRLNVKHACVEIYRGE